MTTSQPTSSQPTTTMPVRATWKQHGNPIKGFEFYGTEVKTPALKAAKVAKVESGPNGVTLKGGNGRELATFAAATKFWAVVPADAPRLVVEPKAPKTPADKLAPVKITAPKGGDQTVAPRKGAIAKAIKATGKSIMAISREHGLNPSQMRRLSLDTVAKVDLVRAELIAKALGVKVADLFGDPTDKAKVKAPAAPATETAPADEAEAARTEADEAKAAQDAAEGSQAEPEADTTEGTTPEATPETPAAE
jgi:lambda repressor-like predicted transcriptional regulator